MTEQQPSAKPEVLIVGAGIGGLMMAILLEQINIPYRIFERVQEVKSLGSAMSFGGEILLALEQLGIYDDLLKISKPYEEIKLFNGQAKQIGSMDITFSKVANGYPVLSFCRPDFYEILRKRVPEEKINYNKKILRYEEKDDKVTLFCSDNTSYSGDILIGADGAHSGVRQCLYKRLDEMSILPKSDLEAFSIGYTVIVGVAKPSDPEIYPVLKEESCNFNQTLFDGNSNCFIITLPENQISWGFGTQISAGTLEEKHFNNSEWNADTSESTLKDYRDFPAPIGGTMGDIFDATPKELISKVYLEEKLFKTWHHGRTVLLGDACHKLHPAGGRGAKNAIEDAISLANCLYAMKDSSSNSIKETFEEYYKQRFSYAEEAFNGSSLNAKILNGQKWYERVIRSFSMGRFSSYFIKKATIHGNLRRLQVAWLPLVPYRGVARALPQYFENDDKNE